MKKQLSTIVGLGFTLLLAIPALAISPYLDYNTPTQIKATFQEQQPVAKPADTGTPDQSRDADVKAIQNLLKADELDRQNNMRDALRQENLEDRAQGNKDLEIALAEKNVDLHLGKALIDMHGNRVRMEEYVLRPTDKQVQFLNLTMRDQRLDYITYTATFNDVVPRNTNGLWHKTFGPDKPAVYLTDETEKFSNMTDSVMLNTQYFDPTLDALTQHYLLPVRQSSLSVNDVVKFGQVRVHATDAFGNLPGAVGATSFNESIIGGNYLTDRATFIWADGTSTTLERYLIDDKGNVRSLNNLGDLAYWMSHLSDLIFNSYTETVWSSTEFNGRNIDNVSQFLTLTYFLSDPLDKNP